MTQPKYVVRALRLTCVDESGFDFLGSDEPYLVFTSYDSSGQVHSAASRVFGDVDSGETRKFDTANNANVYWPRRAAAGGASGPIALSIQLWEHDQGSPDGIAKKTEDLLSMAGHLPVVGEWVRLVSPMIVDKLVDLIEDDIMGSKTLLFHTKLLERLLPSAGSSLVRRYRLGGKSGDLPFEVAGGPDYDLYLQVARVA